jgi:hypothetical protein
MQEHAEKIQKAIESREARQKAEEDRVRAEREAADAKHQRRQSWINGFLANVRPMIDEAAAQTNQLIERDGYSLVSMPSMYRGPMTAPSSYQIRGLRGVNQPIILMFQLNETGFVEATSQPPVSLKSDSIHMDKIDESWINGRFAAFFQAALEI